MGLPPNTRALFFDVFGTCVDWRKTVTDTLSRTAQEALDSNGSSIFSEIRAKTKALTYEQWGEIAQEWRDGYLRFVRGIATDPSKEWKSVDEHHLESLHEILTQHGLLISGANNTAEEGSLWTEAQLAELNLVWHRLDPWPDTNRGLALLNKKFHTITLSNGNISLLTDMVNHGKMPFTHIYSAEMFQSYKPSPKVYLGAAEKIGLKPEECALVAAHLDDLKAAKACGFGAVYVERAREERHEEMKTEGIPDVWVMEKEEGFVAAADALGIEVEE